MMAKRGGEAEPSGTGTDGDPDGDDVTTDAPIPASYEQARDELSEVVAMLEEGGLSLDQSLALWERGQALAAACEKFLAGARERVQAVLAADEPDGTTAG